MTMNAGLGNRKALEGRHRMQSCELCGDPRTCLNEIHVLFDCVELEEARQQTYIGTYVSEMAGKSRPVMYYGFWNNANEKELKRRIMDAETIKNEYLRLLKIKV